MSRLTPDQIQELRSVLEAELIRLERSMVISEEAVRPVELDQTAVGRLSRMDSLLSQGMARTLHEREQVQLAGILAALKRVEAGDYGLCAVCGAPMPYGRLLVFPEAEACASCG